MMMFLENNLEINTNNRTINISRSAKNLVVIFDCRLRYYGYVDLLVKKAYLECCIVIVEFKNFKLDNF